MLENRSTFTGVEQAITRDNPFSALGTNTEGLMTSRECIESAGLDWRVELMEGRKGDLSYAFARLVGIAHNDIEGNLSLGVFSNNFKDDDIYDKVYEISHGDNGTYLVDVDNYVITRYFRTYVANGPDDFDLEETEESWFPLGVKQKMN